MAKINQSNRDRDALQRELDEAVQELNVGWNHIPPDFFEQINMARMEKLQQSKYSGDVQIQELQARIATISVERDEAQKKLHFEIGNSSRLECDLDHTRTQVQLLAKDQV